MSCAPTLIFKGNKQVLVGLPQAQIHLLFPEASDANSQYTVYSYKPAFQVALNSKKELYFKQLLGEGNLGEFIFCV